MKRHLNIYKKELILMLLPSLAGFSFFFIIPFVLCMYYSVVENPVKGEFVGIKNYIGLVSNKIFILAVKNTVIFTIMVVPLNMFLSLLLALLTNRKLPAVKFFRAAFVLPLAVPVVSTTLVWRNLFTIDGSINGLLINAGLLIKGIDYLETRFVLPVAVLLFLWKNIGYCFIIFSTGLANIPSEYYDYVKLETGNPLKVFYHITRVYLTPTSFFVFILSIINSFKVFRDIYLLMGNYPHESIYMLQNFMNNSFKSLDYGKLTSAAIITAVIIYLLVSVLYKVERRIGNGL